MSASPVIALRKAIRTRLLADAGLAAALGANKIFDEPPRDVEPPYAIFLDAQMRDWSADLARGAEQFPVIGVVSTARGVNEALAIGQLIIALLDEAPLALEGHTLIDLRFVSSETKRDSGGRFARVNLRFRATTEYP